MKASRSIPSAHKLSHDAPVSAAPTAFASQIGQFPLSRRRRPRSLARIGQFPLSRRRRPRSLARIGQFPAGEGWRKSLLSSAQALNSRPRPSFSSGRADNACTNLLGSFVRYVRTRGVVKTAESGKTAYFHYILCRTHLPRTARATNSCTPRWFGRRTVRVLLADFCRAFRQ